MKKGRNLHEKRLLKPLVRAQTQGMRFELCRIVMQERLGCWIRRLGTHVSCVQLRLAFWVSAEEACQWPVHRPVKNNCAGPARITVLGLQKLKIGLTLGLKTKMG